jgi:hypothetical protein
MSKKSGYELRYTGDFGLSLYSRHSDYEEALIAKRVAYDVAIANGNKRLAASLEIV